MEEIIPWFLVYVVMVFVFYLAMVIVILGHLYFAFKQRFRWRELCEQLTELREPEIEKTAFLGRSVASYNASIAVGLGASFGLAEGPQAWVQAVVLALIVATAAVGASGTKGNTILIARLLPAAVALIALVILNG